MDGSILFASWRQCASHLIHAFLGQSKSKSQTASRSVQPCSRSSQQRVAMLYSRSPFPPILPLKIAHFHGRSKPRSNTWFLWPTWVLNQNGISIGSAIFAQLMAERPYTLQWAALSPPLNCLFPSTPIHCYWIVVDGIIVNWLMENCGYLRELCLVFDVIEYEWSLNVTVS